jgi:Glycosyltransferase sugar-binding region containing DXD motif
LYAKEENCIRFLTGHVLFDFQKLTLLDNWNPFLAYRGSDKVMRSPPPQTNTRRRNGQLVLPIIYLQPQSKTQRLLPLVIVACCGVWIFAMGAMLERVPPGESLPFMLGPSLSVVEGGHASLESINELGTPVRVLEEADIVDEDNIILTRQSADLGSAAATTASISQAATSPSRTKEQKGPILTHQASQPKVEHKIPNVLIFTHARNLLEFEPDVTNSTKDEQEELLALHKNVHATIDLHPEARVRFLRDEDCIRSLQSALGNKSPLIEYFRKESTGMYKADICRGAALWETGGIYLDVDVGVRMPLFHVLDPNTTFATILVHRDSAHLGNFFQAFMATTPRHPILERYLQLFLEHYQGKRVVKRGPLGVILLRQAFDDVILNQPDEVSFVNHQNFQTLTDNDKHFHLGPKVVDTAHHGRIQLWQEVLYNAKLMSNFIPEPTWGTRRACHFVVVANQRHTLSAPLYSRIEGSRMCPPRSSATVQKETKEGSQKNLSSQGTLQATKTA